MKTIQDILNQLDVFKIKPKDDFVEVTLPIYLFMNWDLNSVELKIKPIDSGYIISDTGNTFKEFNNSPSFYYDLFVKSNNRNFGIKLDNETLYKKYENNFNIVCALDEFNRFFISLDDFIIENNLC